MPAARRSISRMLRSPSCWPGHSRKRPGQEAQSVITPAPAQCRSTKQRDLISRLIKNRSNRFRTQVFWNDEDSFADYAAADARGGVVDDELHRVAAAPGVAAQMPGKMDRPTFVRSRACRLAYRRRERRSPKGAPRQRVGNAQRRCPVPTGSTYAARTEGNAKRGSGLAEPNGASPSSWATRPSCAAPAEIAASIANSGTRIERSSPSFSRSARNSCSSTSLSAATVNPAAIACPPPLISKPRLARGDHCGAEREPGIERPEPLPMPLASATTQAGRS